MVFPLRKPPTRLKPLAELDARCVKMDEPEMIVPLSSLARERSIVVPGNWPVLTDVDSEDGVAPSAETLVLPVNDTNV